MIAVRIQRAFFSRRVGRLTAQGRPCLWRVPRPSRPGSCRKIIALAQSGRDPCSGSTTVKLFPQLSQPRPYVACSPGHIVHLGPGILGKLVEFPPPAACPVGPSSHEPLPNRPCRRFFPKNPKYFPRDARHLGVHVIGEGFPGDAAGPDGSFRIKGILSFAARPVQGKKESKFRVLVALAAAVHHGVPRVGIRSRPDSLGQQAGCQIAPSRHLTLSDPGSPAARGRSGAISVKLTKVVATLPPLTRFSAQRIAAAKSPRVPESYTGALRPPGNACHCPPPVTRITVFVGGRPHLPACRNIFPRVRIETTSISRKA